MADMNERDAKLVQYLSEAYGKERELVASLEAHILMTTRDPYKKRLKQHLKETKGHGKQLQRRIKQLGGGTQTLQAVVGTVTAAAKGPLHAVRGAGEQEKMLKNAKTEYFNEHEEIANYMAIETLAQKVGDKETAKLARDIRRDEERMAKYLETQIRSLTAAVVSEQVPSGQRRASGSGKRSGAKRSTKARAKGSTKAKAKRSTKSASKRATKSSSKRSPKSAAKRSAKTAKSGSRAKSSKASTKSAKARRAGKRAPSRRG
jgi:ferritin-like metal-binding protein YciE